MEVNHVLEMILKQEIAPKKIVHPLMGIGQTGLDGPLAIKAVEKETSQELELGESQIKLNQTRLFHLSTHDTFMIEKHY